MPVNVDGGKLYVRRWRVRGDKVFDDEDYIAHVREKGKEDGDGAEDGGNPNPLTFPERVFTTRRW